MDAGYFHFCCIVETTVNWKKIAYRPESLGDYETRLLLLFATVGHDVVD